MNKIPAMYRNSDPQPQKFVVVYGSSLPKHKLRIEYELLKIGEISARFFWAEALKQKCTPILCFDSRGKGEGIKKNS